MNKGKLAAAAVLALSVATLPAMALGHGKAKGHGKKDGAQAGAWTQSERSQFDERFARFDRNGDGVVTRGEFPGDATLFDRLDLNRDGSVTRAEVQQAIPNRDAAERQLRSYDRNGDGVITRSEFPGTAADFDRLDRNRDGQLSDLDRGNRSQADGKRFRGMDRNSDGMITRDEWRGNDNSFRQHDRNNDGVLAGDELRGNGRAKTHGRSGNKD